MEVIATVEKKKHLNFPSAFTILFFIMLIAIVATWVVPAGFYSKLSYDSETSLLQVVDPKGNISTLPATQEALSQININIGVEQFTDGKIRKPIAIANTYERLEQKPKRLHDLTISMVHGI